MVTIVDTDALIALAKPRDPLHERAIRIEKLLRVVPDHVVISPTTLSEFSLVALQRLGFHDMKQTLSAILASDISVETVNGVDTRAALLLYEKQTTKDNSYCDCYIMALASRLHAAYIFSFDRGYTKNGFVLAEDFFRGMQASGKACRVYATGLSRWDSAYHIACSPIVSFSTKGCGSRHCGSTGQERRNDLSES